MKVSMTLCDPAVLAGRMQEAVCLMLEALRILDEEGAPGAPIAAGRLAMALDDLGVVVPMPGDPG
jgi:hypothetical protein